MLPESKVARMLGVDTRKLAQVRPNLEERGFPQRDPDLGTTCLHAVENWVEQNYGLSPAKKNSSPEETMKSLVEQKAWQQ